MGNVHSVIQIEPRFFEGAAIEIHRSHWDQMSGLYADRTHSEPNILIKEFEKDYWVFCDNSFQETRRFLVVQDGGKRGYEIELAEQLILLAPCLEDALFFVDDEYAGYVERFQIKNGSLETERVVESGGSAFEYLDSFLAGQPDLHARLLVGQAAATARLASSWLRSGHAKAAEDDRREALELYNRAAEISDDWQIRYQQGYLLNRLGEHKPAEAALDLALAGIKDAEVIDRRAHQQTIQLSLGVAASGQGDDHRALELYQQAAALSSQTTEQQARINESVQLINQGRYPEAETACRQVIQKGSSRHEFASALYNLACATALTGRSDEALRSLWAAVTLQPSFRKSACQDKDLDSLQGDPDFRELTQF